ncbi:saccharopine dehydrogenase family protein [Micrococcus luteus]|uniref:saccharopine dehydrogenase family protein n=1 Tax=Micrococcus luteus TaxID=1270 RepID=UPI0021AB1C0F|nr:saccharopine dehydrogenase NADP-binding domain-containing protein [Micrococcus luteus]
MTDSPLHLDHPDAPRIIVLGATGYAGSLVVDALVAQGARPVLAGRNRDSLQHAARRHDGLEVAVADAGDPASLRALVTEGDVLVSTVGPFERYGRPVARAAAERGAHYVDSTGEVGFVKDLKADLDATARRTGATLLPALGFDYAPGMLAGGLALAEAGGRARSLQIGYFADGELDPRVDLSHGTRQTMVAPSPSGRSRGAAGGWRPRARPAGRPSSGSTGRTAAACCSAARSPCSCRGCTACEVEVFNGWFPARPTQIGAAALGAVGWLPGVARGVQALLRPLAGDPGGPDAADRARTGSRVGAIARDAAGRIVADVHLRGPNAYTLTGDLMAWGARQLAAGRAREAGVVSPIQAFGLEDFETACAGAGLVRA